MWCFARLCTYLKVFRHVMACYIWYIYTFLSTCRLSTICLFRWFLSNSILFWWISVIYFNFCAGLLWFFMWHILKAIWKPIHWHLNFSINSKVLFFPNKNFIEKTVESLEHSPITSISKKNSFSENFGKLFSKTFILESFIQVHLQAFLVCEGV